MPLGAGLGDLPGEAGDLPRELAITDGRGFRRSAVGSTLDVSGELDLIVSGIAATSFVIWSGWVATAFAIWPGLSLLESTTFRSPSKERKTPSWPREKKPFGSDFMPAITLLIELSAFGQLCISTHYASKKGI